LADERWQVVEITGAAWKIVSDPPVRFRRPAGMRPLPEPVPGGNLAELLDFVNIADADWPLLAACTLAALLPTGPYPILAVHGEQGSAKTTAARVLRALIDPNRAPLRAQPRNEHELMIAAQNGWLIALDNLSYLPPWLSDALCRLSTGGGFAARELYTDSDEILFDAQRPVLLNGISELTTRADLLDRTVDLSLPRIRDEQRRPEAEFWAAFENARPRLLGSLLDAVVTGLRRLPSVELEQHPRMADFARRAVAAEPAFASPNGSFLAAYTGNRAATNEMVLESSPLGGALLSVAAETFIGNATTLLDRLRAHASDEARAHRNWPKDGRLLSNALRRMAPNLRAVGVEIEFDAPGLRRGIRLSMNAQSSVRSVPSVRSMPATATQAAATQAREDPALNPSASVARATPDAADAADAEMRNELSPALGDQPITDEQLNLLGTAQYGRIRREYEDRP
jgi:hypothetical protein